MISLTLPQLLPISYYQLQNSLQLIHIFMQQAHQLQLIPIGHALFSPEITKPALKKLINFNRQKMLKQVTWLVSGQSPSSGWSDIFPLMISASNLNLRVICAQIQSSFFRQIAHIHFTHLQQLNLLNNQLTNVQAIIFLNCPHLQKLGISTNNITLVSPLLNKVYFPKLKLIDCSNNWVQEVGLGRFFIKAEEVNVIMHSSDSITFLGQDISVYAKCPSFYWKKSQQLFNFYKTRNPLNFKNILQPRCTKAIIKKFNHQNPNPQPIVN